MSANLQLDEQTIRTIVEDVLRGQALTEHLAIAFVVRLVANVGLVVAARLVLGGRDIDESNALFFLVLLSLLTTLHDAWQPVHAHRVRTTPPRMG